MSFYADRIYPRVLKLASSHFDDQRRALLSEADGRVLELGVGTGANLGFYPPQVTEVVAVDPHEAMVAEAEREARRLERGADGEGALPYRIRIERGDAQALPFDDGSFDTVVGVLTFCTIPDPAAAAAEAHRVLRPGGKMLVLEHVAAEPGSLLARVQRWIDPLWSAAAVGCHLDRDTAAVLRGAGFDTAPLERYRDDRFFPPVSPRIRGVVRKA